MPLSRCLSTEVLQYDKTSCTVPRDRRSLADSHRQVTHAFSRFGPHGCSNWDKNTASVMPGLLMCSCIRTQVSHWPASPDKLHTCSSCASNSVEVAAKVWGAIVVDHCLHPQDVQAPGSHICGQQECSLALQIMSSDAAWPYTDTAGAQSTAAVIFSRLCDSTGPLTFTSPARQLSMGLMPCQPTLDARQAYAHMH